MEAPGKRGGVPVSARSTQKEARRQLAEGAAQDSDFAQHCQALEAITMCLPVSVVGNLGQD